MIVFPGDWLKAELYCWVFVCVVLTARGRGLPASEWSE